MINIKFFLGYIFTVWLFFIAYIYLILGVDNYSLVSLILGIVGLVVGIFRIRKIIIQKEDGYSYLEPLRKVSEGLLKENANSFLDELDKSITNKSPYIVGFNQKKYYIEFIEEDDHEELNKRYLLMAKEKDIHIEKKKDNFITKLHTINDVGMDLENYFFDIAKDNHKLFRKNIDSLQNNITILLKPFNISFSLKYFDAIKEKYKENSTKHEIKHETLAYGASIWSSEEIESFKQTSIKLKEKGFIFFVAKYKGDDGWFGILEEEYFSSLKELKVIEVISVYELLDNHIGEQFFTTREQFDNFYITIKDKIEQNTYELIYIMQQTKELPISLSQIAGKGIGLNDENYPKYNDAPMQHIITLDFYDFPHLLKEYPNKRAVSLYISDYMDNEAYEENTSETKVIFLSQSDIDSKKLNRHIDESNKVTGINIQRIKIPKGLFDEKIQKNAWQDELYKYLYNLNYVGSCPIWMQGDDGGNNFICQFDESIFLSFDINFAGGIMYLFDDTAFWQCG